MAIIPPGHLAPSFDTVTVVIQTRDGDLGSRFMPSKLNTNYSPDLKPVSEWLVHYFALPGQFQEELSWWSPPRIKIEGWNLVFTFSLPKLLYGHSARHASQLEPVLRGLEWYLSHDCGLDLACRWFDWQVRRIDVSYNFRLPDPGTCRKAEEQLSRLRFRGRLALRDRRRQYPYWPSETRTIKFYIKGKEMHVHRKEAGYPEGWLKARRSVLDSILRYEEEWRGHGLRRFCGVDKKKEVTVGKLLNEFAAFDVEEHIGWVSKQFAARGPSVSIERVQADIRNGLRKPAAALRFAARVQDEGVEGVRLRMPARSFYRCVSALRKCGVEPAQLESHFDVRWATPVDISEWVSVEHLAHDFDFEDVCQDPLYLLIRGYAREFATDLIAV